MTIGVIDKMRDVNLGTYLTTARAAYQLGVSLRAARKLADSGALDSLKTKGGHRRFSQRGIDKLLASRLHSQDTGEASCQRLTILVVEDDPELRHLYALKLSQLPMRTVVITAANGFEGLARLVGNRPSLLIVDLNAPGVGLHTPGIDGARLLRIIGGVPGLSALTTVAITEFDPEFIAAKDGVPGGIPIFPKPVAFENIRAIACRLYADTQFSSGGRSALPH